MYSTFWLLKYLIRQDDNSSPTKNFPYYNKENKYWLPKKETEVETVIGRFRMLRREQQDDSDSTKTVSFRINYIIKDKFSDELKLHRGVMAYCNALGFCLGANDLRGVS
jgi:hypothetical protein